MRDGRLRGDHAIERHDRATRSSGRWSAAIAGGASTRRRAGPGAGSRSPGSTSADPQRAGRAARGRRRRLTVRAGRDRGAVRLVGAGCRRRRRAMFGAWPGTRRGSRRVDGVPITSSTPRDGVAHGLGLMSQDRRERLCRTTRSPTTSCWPASRRSAAAASSTLATHAPVARADRSAAAIRAPVDRHRGRHAQRRQPAEGAGRPLARRRHAVLAARRSDARRRRRGARRDPRAPAELRRAGCALLLVSSDAEELVDAVRPHPRDARRPARRRARRRRCDRGAADRGRRRMSVRAGPGAPAGGVPRPSAASTDRATTVARVACATTPSAGRRRRSGSSFQVLTDGIFLSQRNLVLLALQTTIVGLAAISAVMLIVTRNFDLSVGSAVALVGVVVACAHRQARVEPAARCRRRDRRRARSGAWNGLWVPRSGCRRSSSPWPGMLDLPRRLADRRPRRHGRPAARDADRLGRRLPAAGPSIAVVIAALGALRGVPVARCPTGSATFGLIRDVRPLVGPALVPAALGPCSRSTCQLGRAFPIWCSARRFCALAADMVMRRTRFGAQLYAIGGNPEAARLAGITSAGRSSSTSSSPGFSTASPAWP